MNIERMRLLERVLVDVIERNRPFDMHHWECGTAACAAGWLCRHPESQAAGLRLEPFEGPNYFGIKGLPALKAFLEISYRESHSLFDSDSHDNAQSVLEAVRKMLAEETAP